MRVVIGVGWASSSLAALAAVVLGGVSLTTVPPTNVVAQLPPAGFTRIDTGPDGGTVWQGLIPDRVAPRTHLVSVVYLPPGASGRMRYPVLYLLQGFRGSPWQFSQGLRLASYRSEEHTSELQSPKRSRMPSSA